MTNQENKHAPQRCRYAHTNIIAEDWRRLADFYVNIFGCKLVPPERRQSGAWLAAGTGVKGAKLAGVHLRLPGHGDAGPTLEIFSYHEMLPKPEACANRQGFGHLAFEVDDVAQALAAVLSAGGKRVGEVVRREIPGVGTLTFTYAGDPEGNLLELQSWS